MYFISNKSRYEGRKKTIIRCILVGETERNNQIDRILVAMASAIGPLKTYEANLREADTTLLWAGNNSFVPSIDTIRTAQSNYNKDHRFDNDPIKELAIGQYAFISSDVVSSKMRGMRSIFS